MCDTKAVIYELFFTLGACSRALADGSRLPDIEEARRAAHAVRRSRIARAVGSPRLKPRISPYETMTVAQLRAEASRRRIKGRSRARRKAQLIVLLKGDL